MFTSFVKKSGRDGKSDARGSSAAAPTTAASAKTKIAATLHSQHEPETTEKSALLSTQKVAPAWSPKVPQPGGSRSFTDLPCLLIFVACVGALVIVMQKAYNDGDPRRLFHVRNYKGQLCGIDLPDKPFGYWCTLPGRGGDLSLQSLGDVGLDYQHPICVASCPMASGDGSNLCFDSSTGGTRVVTNYATAAVGGRYCMPQAGQQLLNKVLSNFESHPVEKYVEDTVSSVKKGWKILLIGLGISLALSYIYIIFLECCAGCMIYGSLLVCFFVSAACGIGVLAASLKLPGFLASMESIGWTPDGGGLDGIPKSGDGTIDMIIGIAFLLVAFITLAFACCFQQAIRICVKATQTTGVFLQHSPSMFLEPILNLIARIAIWVVMTFGFAYLLSTVEADSDIVHNFNWKAEDLVAVIFYLIMWIWLNELCTVQSHFVIANAAGRWYFTEHNEHGVKVMLKEGGVCGCCPLIIQGYCSSVKHFGSLCLGSLLVALFRPFKLVLTLILYVEIIVDKSLRWICFCCRCCGCQCCVLCFRKFFAYFGKGAFIDLAVNPQPLGFCSGICCAYWESAKRSVELIYETKESFHLPEMDMYHGATWLFTFVGMVLVGAGSSTTAVILSSKVHPWNDTTSFDYIQDPSTLAIFCFVIGAVIALCFMLIFDTAWDALLICMCYDMKDRRENPPPKYGGHHEAPKDTGFFSSFALCSRKNQQAHATTEKVHVPVYAHAQMEEMVTGKRTPISKDGMGSFASTAQARTFSSTH